MQIVNGLHFDNLRGDFYGGLTAAVVALPLALAFGVSSGAGPIAGIYGAIFVGFFAAIFGGTPAQVSGPTGPMTVVMAAVFTQYTAMFPEDPAKGAAVAFTVVIMGGVFQILFGILKIGKYINLVPHPVISGFMSGIGIIIILLQLGPLLGHAAKSGTLAAAQAIPEILSNPVMDALLLGLMTIAIVYFLPKRINRILPSPLLALVVGTLVMLVFMPNSEATILGAIPTGLPDPQLPVFEASLIVDMVKSALILALLGAIDSLLTSLVADNMTRTYHKSDKELIGQGIGNTVAGLFGGLPGAGATMRTVVNVHAGGQTPISGALHASVLLIIVLGAGGLASSIPHAVLAGILIKVGTDIIDWDYLKRMHSAPKAGVVIMLTVFFITVFVDLITAVGVGIVMASLLLMNRVSEQQLNQMIATTDNNTELPLSDVEQQIMNEAKGRILLYHLSGPLSFGAAKGMARRLSNFDQYDVLVLDMTSVPSIDFTISRAIEDMIHDAQDRNRHAYLVGTQKKVIKFLNRQGVLPQLHKGHQLSSRLEALKDALQYISNKDQDGMRSDKANA